MCLEYKTLAVNNSAQGLCTLLSCLTLEHYWLFHLQSIDLIDKLIYMWTEWVLGRIRDWTAGFKTQGAQAYQCFVAGLIWTYIGLSLLISSVFIYVCIKKLTIYRRTGLYPWLHPRWRRRRFFLLFFLRLLAPRCRSLLGLVLLTSHPLPSPIFQHCLFPAATTTSQLQLSPPPHTYPVMAAVTARPTVWLCPLSCPPLLFIWIDTAS